MILAVNSKFFRFKFDFGELSGGPTFSKCTIEYFTKSSIRVIFEFMYMQCIRSHARRPRFLQLISVCELYQVSGMHKYVMPHILQHLGPTAIKILGVGYEFRPMSDRLAREAGKYVKGNLRDLLMKEDFSNSLTAADGLGDLLKFALQGKW